MDAGLPTIHRSPRYQPTLQGERQTNKMSLHRWGVRGTRTHHGPIPWWMFLEPITCETHINDDKNIIISTYYKRETHIHEKKSWNQTPRLDLPELHACGQRWSIPGAALWQVNVRNTQTHRSSASAKDGILPYPASLEPICPLDSLLCSHGTQATAAASHAHCGHPSMELNFWGTPNWGRKDIFSPSALSKWWEGRPWGGPLLDVVTEPNLNPSLPCLEHTNEQSAKIWATSQWKQKPTSWLAVTPTWAFVSAVCSLGGYYTFYLQNFV